MPATSTGQVVIQPARRVRGRLRVPGDKSISHRYAIIAALARGTSRIQGYAPGADCATTLATIAQQNTGGAGLDTLDSIEGLIGSSFGDALTGNGEANRLDGAAGNDALVGDSKSNILRGGAGADAVYGGAGNDSLHGDTGADKLFGQAGNDTLFARSTPLEKDHLDGGAGTDRAQIDTLNAKTSIETILA